MFNYKTYCLDGEEWRDIPCYEGIYQASNLGRIRSVDGKITESDIHGLRKWKGRILRNKTKTPRKEGYKVSLWKNKKNYDYLVSRLVCLTFHGIPDNYKTEDVKIRMTVNHKDGNRFNNNINNLEWLSIGDNVRHAFENNLVPQHNIILKNLKTGELKEFKSKSKASVFLGRNTHYLSNQINRNHKITDKYKTEYHVIQCNVIGNNNGW